MTGTETQDIDLGLPVLLTREQAAAWCQTSINLIDQWSYEPGFPVIRRNTGHFVRIHRVAFDRWLEQKAVATNPEPTYALPEPPRRIRRGGSGTS